MTSTPKAQQLIVATLLGVFLSGAVEAQQVSPSARGGFEETSVDAAKQSLANVFASLIEQGIPREYEKRKEWGKTKK